MKRLFSFLLIVFVIFVFNISAAATNAGSVTIESADDIKAWYNNNGSQTNDTVAASVYATYLSYADSDNVLIYYNGWNYFYSGTATIDGDSCTLSDTYNSVLKWSQFDGIRNGAGDIAGRTLDSSAVFSIIQDPIDFTNILYDPMIATPDFSVFYTDDTSTLPRFPAQIQINNASDNYFVQIQIENLLPSVVAIGNDYSYAVMRYYQPESHFIYDASDLILSANASSALISGLASQYWRSDVNGYDGVEFTTPSSVPDNFENTPSYIFATSLYESTYRKIALFYGNVTTISMRYFVVRDGVVYGGMVRSWTNLNNVGFKDTIPDYYKPNQIAQGYETDKDGDIVPIETSTPYVDVPSNQFGKKTGFSININLGSNVPNYPDYPTIATYNTDNLLVNALDTAKQLPEFFSSSIAIFNGIFNGILPDPFWGIIMTGFLFSIVIMIIKVL